jgi:hypothetical protein
VLIRFIAHGNLLATHDQLIGRVASGLALPATSRYQADQRRALGTNVRHRAEQSVSEPANTVSNVGILDDAIVCNISAGEQYGRSRTAGASNSSLTSAIRD